jgi:hypothetical protein
MEKYILNFTYLNGEYILKNYYNLKNMEEVLKWSQENIHLPIPTIYRIFNYGMIYYLDNAKYIQKEILDFLFKNKKKLVINLENKKIEEYLKEYFEKYKYYNKNNKDEIKFL